MGDAMGMDCEHSQNYAAAFSRAMQLFVGRGKPYSVEAISEVTGIQPNTLYAWMAGTTSPSYAGALELMRVLPAAFTNMVLAPAGLSGASKPDDGNDLHGAKLHTVVCEVAHSLAKKREDGRIDHIEDAQLRPDLARLIEAAGAYMATPAPTLRAVGEGE